MPVIDTLKYRTRNLGYFLHFFDLTSFAVSYQGMGEWGPCFGKKPFKFSSP